MQKMTKNGQNAHPKKEDSNVSRHWFRVAWNGVFLVQFKTSNYSSHVQCVGVVNFKISSVFNMSVFFYN